MNLADVFISHSSKDRIVAEAARDRIERAGFRCWMAPIDILPGQDYGEAIVDAIRQSRIFLLVFSSASVDSAQVRRETERAAKLGHRGIMMLDWSPERPFNHPADSLARYTTSSRRGCKSVGAGDCTVS